LSKSVCGGSLTSKKFEPEVSLLADMVLCLTREITKFKNVLHRVK